MDATIIVLLPKRMAYEIVVLFGECGVLSSVRGDSAKGSVLETGSVSIIRRGEQALSIKRERQETSACKCNTASLDEEEATNGRRGG